MDVRFGVYCESYAILSAKNTFVKSTVSGSAPFAVLQYLQIEICVRHLVLDVNVEHSVLFFCA